MQLDSKTRGLAARWVVAIIVSAGAILPAWGQASTWQENFDSSPVNANLAMWVDSRLGAAAPDAKGLFHVAIDPLDATNHVYGTDAAGPIRLHGVRQGGIPRVGFVSTLVSPTLEEGGTISGRILFDRAEGRAGLTLLSGLPNHDAYLLLALSPQPDSDGATLRAFAWDSTRGGDVTGTLEGELQHEVEIDSAAWFRFRVRVDRTPGASTVHARLWPEGAEEPDAWQVRAIDSRREGLHDVRFGLWSAGRGGAWVDDLSIESEVVTDVRAPSIAIFESGNPFPDGFAFNRDVRPDIRVDDDDPSPVVIAELNGEPFPVAGVVSAEGPHELRVEVIDRAGNRASASVRFSVDKTPPDLALTSHANGSLLTSALPTLAGTSGDAVEVTVGGRPAVVDAGAGTWTLPAFPLLEGTNSLAITGRDRAGNVSAISPVLVLDTRGPALVVRSPAHDSCTSAASVLLEGDAPDTHLAGVVVRDSLSGIETVATVDRETGSWSATLPMADAGEHEFTITATDEAGHTSTAVVSVRVDRESPVIEVTEGGAPFARSIVNRALALFVRATDADSGVVVEATLDGEPYLSGRNVAGEGSHTLVVTARDCAGNNDTKTIVFTIDVTAPVIGALAPANDAALGEMPDRITGTVTDESSDVVAVELVGTGLTVTPANGAFTLSGVPFVEGTNRFTLRARDAAGNEATVDYVVTVRTEAPVVTISENGTPMVDGALFNRDVTPEIVSSDPEASITATLGGAAYVPGTAITSEGTHTLVATATNALGKTGSKTVSFTIDKSSPSVAITTPVDGASIAADVVTVTGTATGATSVLVNGVTATLSGTSFTANVALDLGENLITAVARDEAGNSARADITVTRAGAGPAIVLLFPPDKSLTNRPKTEVLGRVISPANVTEVEISPLPPGAGPGVRVTPNAAGDFRLSDLPLQEGENTITATAIGTDGKTTSVTISLTGDFTAPTLAVLANGAALGEGARFPESPGLTLEAGDNATAEPVTTLLLDGGVLPAVIANGGHLVVATATDAAGNTTRLERTFFVGDAGTGTTGCSVTGLDPASGSILTSTVTRLAGRTSAPAVKVNGVATEVVDGSFCTTVELPAEGANPIEIVCTTLAGEPIGDPVALALIRSTGQPSVTITSPAEGQVVTPAVDNTATKIIVTGEAGPGVVSVSVNGIVKSLDGTDLGATRAFSVENVPLAGGLNILAVRGETAAKRGVVATRRVVLLEGAPRIAITSSIGSVPTGATSVDVSGTWSNLDPATLAVTGGAAVSSTRLSDTHGTFVANVPLAIGVNTITVDGRFGSLAAEPASVTVTRSDSAPWVAIATPDNTVTAADTIEVNGTFAADAGARVEVSGVAATLSGDTFSATATLSTVPGAPNPIVARVIELDGGVSVDTILVTRFGGTFDVEETFPAPGSAQIPVTFQLLVRLSHDVDHSTVAGSIRLENAAGQPVSGILRTDRDVVTFAPSAPLGAGETYTLRVTTGLRDLAGRALGTDYVATFTTEPGPATSAPELAALPQVFCGETLPVTGTAHAGARVRLDTAGLQFFTNADATGAYHFDVPVIGAEGYRLVRVRVVGSDGSMSEAAESCLRIECGGAQVVSAVYDRTVNSLTITFNRDIDPSTVIIGSTILLDRAGLPVSGTVAQSSGTTFVVTPAEDLTEASFRLTVTTGVEDTSGNALRFPHTQSFTLGGAPIDVPPGHGYITGEVYDATTGRPLQGASVNVAPSGALSSGAPASPPAGSPASSPAVTDARGRYAMALPEGAHTIEVTAFEHTTVWRQIVVPAGTGVVPIDIRLTTHGVSAAIASTDLTIQHGGETPVTTPVTLTVPSGSLTAGSTVTLTSVGTQSLAGLLPLGWSPLASAEVVAIDGTPSGRTFQVRPSGAENTVNTPLTATLTFQVPGDAITTAAQTLTAVRYDATRDEWHVLDAAVNVTNDTATISLTSDGAYALVYPDKGPGVTTPPPASGGIALVGITDPCATPNACGDLTKDTFTLDPPVVLPDQRTTATLRVNSTLNTQHSTFPSGTAVQAYIDEELQLADGSTITDPPFATDLLLYRGLDGGAGEARFHLAPSKRAAEVILQVGYEHIRVHPYPGRLDRGTLIGNEGGRVPGDGTVSIDIPEGAAPEPVHAEVARLSDTQLGAWQLEGYTVLGGFDFTLTRATSTAPQDLDGDGQPDPIAGVQLFKPASMTYVVDRTELPAPDSQIILAEVLSGDSAGIIRLTALMSDGAGSAKRASSLTAETAIRYTTQLPTTALPVDGLVREGTYLVLAANQPVAYATGLVRLGSPAGPIAAGAKVSTSPEPQAPSLGVNDLVRTTGIYAIPVPAAAFALTPSSRTLGTGTPYENPAAVESGSVQNIQLVLTPEPLRVETTTPANGATEVSLTTNVQIVFSALLDPASVTAGSITVVDAVTRVAAPGATAIPQVASQFLNWNVAVDQDGQPVRLKPNARYIIRISPSVRSANGAPLSSTNAISFETLTRLTNTEINTAKIRITIPENGVSTIIGNAKEGTVNGALPEGWQAIPVRRGRDFRERYQDTAATDGSFRITIGTTPGDEVSIHDVIDLQIVNTSGILAAVIRLTPFVTPDGKGFIAPSDRETRFTSIDNVTVTVPAGAFDAPTLVTVEPETQTAFAAVPAFTEELQLAGAVRLSFDGVAKKRLQLRLPAPDGSTDSPLHLLGLLGRSTRGQRVMIVDTLRLDGGEFTTEAGTSTARLSARKVGAPVGSESATLTGTEVKDALLGAVRAGVYANVSLVQPFAFAAIEGLQGNYDLFWDTMESLYAASFYLAENRGSVVIPVIANQAFTVVGTDSATGLQAFSKVYDPIIPGDPGVAVVVPTPDAPTTGPYPIYASPGRVEILDIEVEDADIRSIHNFVVRAGNGFVTISNGTPALPADVPVSVLNVSRGELDSNRLDGLRVKGSIGDRIVLIVGDAAARSTDAVSIVFSEPIYLGTAGTDAGVDAYLRSIFKVEKSTTTPPDYASGDVTPFARFRADSGGRRVILGFPGELEKGARYRLTIKRTLSNTSQTLKIGQAILDDETTEPLAEDLTLLFTVASPPGLVGSFDIRQTETAAAGQVRDLDLQGNVLFISALDGGLLAYDAANPAGIRSDSLPMAYVPAGTAGDFWALATDHHGRIFTTTTGSMFAALRTYRLEDFAPDANPHVPGSEPRVVTKPTGTATLSFVLGANAGTTLSSSTLLSDIPEALPRKIQVALQDSERAYQDAADFKTKTGATVVATEGGAERLGLSIPMEEGYPYNLERITVENLTTGNSWSADATPQTPARFDYVVASPGDRLRVRLNQRTYAVVSLFGYGIAVYDLNAAESNDAAEQHPGYERLREQLRLTRGGINSECTFQASAEAIQDLALSPQAIIVPERSTPNLNVYAVDVRKGVADLTVQGSQFGETGSICDRNGNGLILRASTRDGDHPRLQKLRDAFLAKAGREPRVRFSGAAYFHWEITANDNQAIRAARTQTVGGLEAQDIPPGVRGSISGLAASRDYLLVPGNEAGLLIIETAGTPAAKGTSYKPLNDANLADIIWVPNGAYAVRVVPGTSLVTLVDGLGHLLLADLSTIDERYDDEGDPVANDALFRTVGRCLTGDGPDGVGIADPRIIWRSSEPVVTGTLAPVVDPDTGLVIGGLGETVKIVATTEPRLRVMVDLGDGRGLQEVGGVVPLGLEPPAEIAKRIAALDPARRADASLGAFRLELTLPGGAAEELPDNAITLALESERVLGAPAAQTDEPLPPAHLRSASAAGLADGRTDAESIRLTRAVPPSMASFLRRQRGYNRFVSPWIVAIADPRASEEHSWTYPAGTNTDDAKRAYEREAGCAECARPARLRGRADVQEIFSAGWLFATRLESNALTGLPYVGDTVSLAARFATVPFDTLRTPDVFIPAQSPAVAEGLIDGIVFIHNGELQLSTADLDLGGRAGWNAVADRSYRSRTIGGTALGLGWDSTLFRRLRPLPSGNVEYRDGTGNVHLFESTSGLLGGSGYRAPAGLFLRLARRGDGWTLTDPQRRIMTFDSMGRLVSWSDEFYKGEGVEGGNVVRYLYDEHGQLGAIVDPVGRTSYLEYWQEGDTAPGAHAGLLRQIRDWRGRVVEFQYDSIGRLTKVLLPEAHTADGVPAEYRHAGTGRPALTYAYTTAPTGYNDFLELAGNLASRRMPNEAATGPARATYTYDSTANPLKRDRLTGQLWASGDTVSIEYTSATEVKTTDARGQVRDYVLTTPEKGSVDRGVHIASVTLKGVPVVATNGTSAAPSLNAAPQDLTTTFGYHEEGLVESATYPGGLTETQTWIAPPNFPDALVADTTESKAADGSIHAKFLYQADGSTVAPLAVCRAYAACPATNEEGGKFRALQVPNRDQLTTVRDDPETGVKIVRKTNAAGQLEELRSEDSTTGEVASLTKILYWSTSSPGLVDRGQPFYVKQGGDALRQVFGYKILPGGGYQVETTDQIRGTTSTAEYDAYDRLVKRQVRDSGGLLDDQRFGYDANGELAYEMRKQGTLGFVETFYEYDTLGRPVRRRVTDANVNGTPGTVEQKTEYAPGQREITVYDPVTEGAEPQAKTVTELDTLGRTTRTRRVAGELAIEQHFGYDERGLPAYQSDGVRTAVLTRRDGFGREKTTLRSDGTSLTREWSAWDELVQANETSAPDSEGQSAIAAQTFWQYSPEGTLKRTAERQGALYRATENIWKNGGALTQVRAGLAPSPPADLAANQTLRAVETDRDQAGRITSTRAGSYVGTDGSLDNGLVYAKSTVTSFSGAFPATSTAADAETGVTYDSTSAFDGLGRLRRALEAGTAYQTDLAYDESGNVLSVTAPGMNAATATYDSRGLVLTQTRPDGASVTFRYDARGTLTSYTDEAGEETRFDTDALGRVTTIHYPEGTTEETRYENVTGAVRATKDRAGLWLSYQYDNGGRVATVHLGEDPATAPVTVRYTYDTAGRLQRIANADAAIEFGEYDHLGNPGVTRSIRYGASSGLGEAPIKRDVHTQGHVWSVFDERTRWRMPAAGDDLPDTEAGPDTSTSWLTWIEEERDGAGNARTRRQAAAKSGEATGHLLTDTTWRGAGRPKSRKIFDTSGTSLLTSFFEYADGTGDVTGPKSGLLGEMSTQNADAIVLAGSLTLHDSAMRIAGAKDLGLQRRGSLWSYDARGRLANAKILTLVGTEVPQPATIDTLSAADFRSQRDARPGRLTAPQRETLGLAALDVEPPTRDFAELTGHRIQSVTESLGEIAAPARSFSWAGGRRTSDGRWTVHYDAFGRAVQVESAERRITYTYNPNNRVVGRLAERAFGSTWATEDRGDVLEKDGLPADTTWVWDPITDRLVAIYEAGKSAAAIDPQAGLLRQFLHGDAAYDDPVLVKIALLAGAPPTTYCPIVDHAATGSVHAVVGEDGTLVERILYADPYGDAPRYLTGAVADQMSIEIEKDGDDNIAEVRVRVRFSEAIKEASLTGGLRLATLTLSGSVAAETTIAPALEEGSTSSVVWTIPAAEWTRMTDRSDADALEISVGSTLRFAGWGETPVTAPPGWAKTIYGLGSSAEWPVSKRYRLTTLATEAAGIAAGETKTIPVFDLADLYLFANTRSATKVLTGFHAAPFVEPATGYVYMRARWLDPATGNFLTSDPSLYSDSSNLHAAFAWDPVNNRDPLGTNVVDTTRDVLGLYVRLQLQDALTVIGNVPGLSPILTSPRFWGMLQLGGGAAEITIGIGAASTPTGVGQLVGGLAIAHGLDTAWTGVKQIWTGERQRTFTSLQIEGAARVYGASAERAEMIGEWGDAGLGIVLSIGAGRFAMGRPLAASGTEGVTLEVPTSGVSGYDSLNGQGLYILRDADGVIRYVGIGDVPTRVAAHARDMRIHQPLGIRKSELFAEVVWDVGTLTKAEARGLEQLLIGRFGGPTSRAGTGQLINRAVSFSNRNVNRFRYRHAVTKDLWKQTLRRLRELDAAW